MLNGHSQNGVTESDDFDQLFSLSDLNEFDMGKYIMKILPGSDRFYRYKTDRASRMLSIMDSQRKEGRFCDAVLCVKGERHPVHKLVLASASSYFASLFSHQNMSQGNALQEVDLTKTVPCPVALKIIIDFIYTSEVQLNDKIVRMDGFFF